MSWDEPARNESQPPQNSGNQPLFQPLPTPQSPPQPQPFGGWNAPTGAPDPAYQADQTRAFGTADQPAPFGAAPAPQQPFDQTNPMATPYGAFGTQPPPAPPKKKRTGLVVGAAVVVVAAAVGGYAAFGGSKTAATQNTAASGGSTATSAASDGASAGAGAGAGTSTTAAATDAPSGGATGSGGASGGLTLPASVDGLVQVDNSAADAIKSSTQSGLASSGILTGAQVAVYGTSSTTPVLVVIDEPFASMSSDMRTMFQAMSPALFAQTMASGQGLTNPTKETSTDPNTTLTCGTGTSGSSSNTMCIWVDKVSFGVVTYVSQESDSTAGKQSDALRAAAEAG